MRIASEERMSVPCRILVVDDAPNNVMLLEDILTARGYKVATARDGTEALARIDSEAPDLVLLDVIMAGLDGFQVCERLRADHNTRDIPVIFLTALDGTFDKVRAFSAGAVDYVTKPFQSEELLARVGTHLALRQARQSVEEQNARLRAEIEAHNRSKGTIECLVEEIRSSHDFGEILGESPALLRLLDQVGRVAGTDSTVLIQGETGTGKELIARAIHSRSQRLERPLIKINCAALPRDLVESELFGHEKGAFTGAAQQRRGRFEMADGGSLFLDEVGELPLETQPKLLRVLQEQEFERVGGTKLLRTNVRLIAATNRDLQQRVSAGAFRSDLYYRLNVFPLVLPPLRERRADIPRLIRHFMDRAARKLGKPLTDVSPDLLEHAMAYDWPGNVRELENFVERSAILAKSPVLESADPLVTQAPQAAPKPATAQPSPETLKDVERSHILRVLEQTQWAIEGERGAARILGLNPSTLRGRLRKLGLRKHS
ncbi:MAG: transcriptional regulator [Betaproteobacteria bacterium RIFCSPLOWO2_02_64_14]|nr:MAG: transcriptional regulator [Betaproteobacteria bacterium RIFCSPLOWO2_02_64_14]